MANECHCLHPDEYAVHRWSLFPSDNGDVSVLLPQEAETEICNWLKNVTFSAGMIENPNRLYGKILFDQRGDIEDFEICTLNYEMLQPGFKNWMNTLASGEILLDIVNSVLNLVPTEVRDRYLRFVPLSGLAVSRLIDNSPNLHGKCNFLRNHSTLLQEFLMPALDFQYAVAESHESSRSALASCRYDLRRILNSTRHYQYGLLRCKYTADVQDTWKALIMVVLTLMILCDCLDNRMQRLVQYLMQGNIEQSLTSRPLAEAFRNLRSRATPSGTELLKMDLHQCRFPFTRVLKQGVIPSPRSLLSDCSETEPNSRFYRL